MPHQQTYSERRPIIGWIVRNTSARSATLSSLPSPLAMKSPGAASGALSASSLPLSLLDCSSTLGTLHEPYTRRAKTHRHHIRLVEHVVRRQQLCIGDERLQVSARVAGALRSKIVLQATERKHSQSRDQNQRPMPYKTDIATKYIAHLAPDALENGKTLLMIGQGNLNQLVQTARAQQRRVDEVGTRRDADDVDADARLHTIQLSEQLVHHAISDAGGVVAASRSKRVKLIKHDHAWFGRGGTTKEIAHTLFGGSNVLGKQHVSCWEERKGVRKKG
jgi:hypothetical protein